MDKRSDLDTANAGISGNTPGWALQPQDIQVGQFLTVSRSWVAHDGKSACSDNMLVSFSMLRSTMLYKALPVFVHVSFAIYSIESKHHTSSSAFTYRWYYLTEDNHWAPLDQKESIKLDSCYE